METGLALYLKMLVLCSNFISLLNFTLVYLYYMFMKIISVLV